MSCALKITILLVAGKGARHTFGAARNPELGNATDDAEYILRVELLKALLPPRNLEDGQPGAARSEDLLLAVSEEVTRNGILCRCGLLHRQGVQRHGREASHGGRRRALARVVLPCLSFEDAEAGLESGCVMQDSSRAFRRVGARQLKLRGGRKLAQAVEHREIFTVKEAKAPRIQCRPDPANWWHGPTKILCRKVNEAQRRRE